MNIPIAALLERKGSAVYSVAPTMTIAEAVAEMNRMRSGCEQSGQPQLPKRPVLDPPPPKLAQVVWQFWRPKATSTTPPLLTATQASRMPLIWFEHLSAPFRTEGQERGTHRLMIFQTASSCQARSHKPDTWRLEKV